MSPNQSSYLFKPLEPPKMPWTHWATSLLVHVGALALILTVPIAVHESIKPRAKLSETALVAPRPIPPQPPVKMEAPPPVVAPKVQFKAPEVKPVEVKKAIIPPPVELPRHIEPPKLEAPKIEVAKAPAPKFESPVAPQTAPAPRPAIKTDVFAANPDTPMGPKAQGREVTMGGFGDPNGVPVSATSTGKGLTVAQVGSFDLPAGSGVGGGGGKGKVVASAGFGSSGTPGPTGTTNRAAVQSSGFGEYKPAEPQPRAAKPAAPAETPVEILYKPKPAYTPEARQLNLEGEVQLEVVFSATGQIHVLRVMRGLGHGLDESARTAAGQIRFRPGTRDGTPVDMKGIVHIIFEIS
jgi:TonB family protein